MNTEKISYGSLEELQAMDEKKRLEKMSPEERKNWRKWFADQMENYDPGGKKAHEIAKKYAKKEGEMADFNEIAEKLRLEDMGELMFGDINCRECGTKLRVGKDSQGNKWNYCPKCEKRSLQCTEEDLPSPSSLPPEDD